MLNKYFQKGIAVALTSVMAFTFIGTNMGQKNVNADLIDALLSYDMTGDINTGVTPYEEKTFDMSLTTGVEGFVNRLYSVCLGRTADPGGFNTWCNLLASGRISGAYAARGFVFSGEFMANEYSNEEYIEVLYKVFFNRTPDEVGFQTWMELLEAGMSRMDVMYGFVDSTEWANVCLTFDIRSGGLGTASIGVEPEDGVKTFVLSLYSDCLGRVPDANGYRQWYDALIAQDTTGIDVALGFFYSNEFKAKIATLTPEEVVNVFYKVFLNRTGSYWDVYDWAFEYNWYGINVLFNGFANSAEFANKCNDCGILVGGPANMSVPDIEENFLNFAYNQDYGISTLNGASLNSHNSYVLFNAQGSTTKQTRYTISSKDWTAIENFAKTHFVDSWTPGQKAAYTLYWIHFNVDYATTNAQWSAITNLGYAQAIFEKRLGQCAQYNGAMCEMLCYLGFDANMVQGYRGSATSKSQHFWCEVTIDGKIYVVETGNKKDGNWWYFCVPYSSTRKYVKNGVVQG